jgi:hypothetical protein
MNEPLIQGGNNDISSQRTGASTNIATNQLTPSPEQILNVRNSLRSTSQVLQCPYCKTLAQTRAETELSPSNIICSIAGLGIGWCIFQKCRGKDLNCYNAEHYCIKCNSNLASYYAC